MATRFLSSTCNLVKPTLHAVTAIALSVAPALADNSQNPGGFWYLSDQPAGWYFDAFIGLEYEPNYAGADNYELEPEVNARAFYRDAHNRRYFIAIGEAGAIFPLSPDLMFAAVLEYEEGRDEGDDDALIGLEEIDDTLEGQFTLTYRFWPNTYAAAVFQPDLLDNGKGLVYFLGIGHDRMLMQDQLRLSTTLDVSFANGEHMRTEFGISESGSIASGLPAYRPDGGLKSITGALGLEYTFARRWSALFDVELEYYLGDAADSPLVKDEGSDLTYELTAGVRYRF